MSIQADWLTDTPRSRATDPVTSHLAADKVRDSGTLGRQQAHVLDLVQAYPGHTSAELAQIDAKRSGKVWQELRPMFGRRLPELEPVHIRRCSKGNERVCTVTGEPCVTWWPR